MVYKGGLNGQAKVLGEGELVNITDADEGSLAGEEGLSGLEREVLVWLNEIKEHDEGKGNDMLTSLT